MDEFEYQRERRNQARLERFGSNNPFCIIGGENDPRVLQQHHPGGHKYTEETVTLCLNHHAKAEELRLDHPQETAGPHSQWEIEGRLLLGLSDLLTLLEHVPAEIVSLTRRIARRLIETGQLFGDGA